MTINVQRDRSPISGPGWKATTGDNTDSAFGHTMKEAIWAVAARCLPRGGSATVIVNGQAEYVVTARD